MNSTKSSSTIYSESMAQHVTLESIPMLVFSWNVNGHVEPNLQSLKDQMLFPKPPGSESADPTEDPFFGLHPQIVIVGFQELIELSTTNVIGNAVSSQETIEKLNQWEGNILTLLIDVNDEFEVLAKHSMVGLGLIVFVWKSLRKIMKNVAIAELARGVGGVLGNKGAIYVRMELYDTSVCIINSHFAAHREKIKKRNHDYYAILNHPAFPDVTYAKNHQTLQTVDPTLKAVKARSMLTNIKKKLQSFAHTHGNPALQSAAGGSQVNSVGSHGISSNALDPYAAASNNSSAATGNQRGSSRSRSSYSSNRSHHSYYSLSEENEESGNTNNNNTSTDPKHLSSASGRHSIASAISEPIAGLKSDISKLGVFFPPLKADDHDIIIWLGDLNYRIVSTLETETVYSMIESNDCMTLLTYDQLNQEKEKNNIFQGFNEGLLTFPPTYQYIPGKDIYDQRKEGKKRCPAWCDRILWRIGKNNTEKLILQEIHNREQQMMKKQLRRNSLQLEMKKTSSRTLVLAAAEGDELSTKSASTASMASHSNNPSRILTAFSSFTKSLHNVKKPEGGEEEEAASSAGGEKTLHRRDSEGSSSPDSSDDDKGGAGGVDKILSLSNSTLDDLIGKSGSADSTNGGGNGKFKNMKPEKTDVSGIIIPEEDEDAEDGGGNGNNVDDDDDAASADDDEEGSEPGEGGGEKKKTNRKHRLSMKEVNEIQKIAEQLLKKASFTQPRNSLPRHSNSNSFYNQSRHNTVLTPGASLKEPMEELIPLESPPLARPLSESLENFSETSLSPRSGLPESSPEGNTPGGNLVSYDNTPTTVNQSTKTSSSEDTQAAKVRISKAIEKIQSKLKREKQMESGSARLESHEEEEEGEQLDEKQDSDALAYRKLEMMELLTYDRCPHSLSDHKAVRAFLNMKVKR
jgi:hypothetical protein